MAGCISKIFVLGKENKMVSERRLEKYQECIEENPKMRNQVIVKDGKGVLFLGGKRYKCEKVEGYVKFTDDEYVENILSQDICICILPKQRLLVAHNEKWFMGGYKKENSSDCFLFLHAVSEYDEVFIIWIADEEIPICIMLGDCEMEDVSIGTIMFKVLKYMMFNKSFAKLGGLEKECLPESGDIDEFE